MAKKQFDIVSRIYEAYYADDFVTVENLMFELEDSGMTDVAAQVRSELEDLIYEKHYMDDAADWEF